MPGNKNDKLVKVSRTTHGEIMRIAARDGTSMSDVVAKAVELYSRREFLDDANKDFAAPKDDHAAWEAEKKEREETGV